MAATVGVVDLELGRMAAELRLPNGSSLAREVRISPDGHYAVLAHNLAHFQVPTTQVERGWMNTSALTLLDVDGRRILATVLLDDVDRGAANPWAVAWSGDARRLFVTHAGTHEVSAIDFAALLGKLAQRPAQGAGEPATTTDDLSFLAECRERVKLAGRGPRAMAVAGERAYVAGYFSDTLETLETGPRPATPSRVLLGPPARLSPDPAADSQESPPGTPCAASPASQLRQGEALFNDATICFQGWQRLRKLPLRGRARGWAELGLAQRRPRKPEEHQEPLAGSQDPARHEHGRAHLGRGGGARRPPAHSLCGSFRGSGRSARCLAQEPESHAQPECGNRGLSAAAERGRALFNRPGIGCASCHKPGLFTDLQSYDVGTAGPTDQGAREFDTPSLVEVWRTAPYLHDGSAATLRDVLTARNRSQRHGRTSRLSEQELSDLVEYLLFL